MVKESIKKEAEEIIAYSNEIIKANRKWGNEEERMEKPSRLTYK